MRNVLIAFVALLSFAVFAGSAIADSIQYRLGVTGRIGLIVPSDSTELALGTIGTDADFIGGGGFIYGVTGNIAAELDVTHASFGSNAGINFDITNIALGVQYRFPDVPVMHLVPYGGAGLDILLNGADKGASVDDNVGAHLSAGLDYFIRRRIALNAEMKGVLAPNADIRTSGNKIGSFDPSSFSMTVGVRYFFN
jgi:outer membrane protein